MNYFIKNLIVINNTRRNKLNEIIHNNRIKFNTIQYSTKYNLQRFSCITENERLGGN